MGEVRKSWRSTGKGWRSNRGYMFAMMLAMLALMAVMGVGLSRLMMTTKATTQMQRTQDTKQLMNSVVMTLSSKAADGDGDFVLEPPAYSTETITGFTAPTNGGAVGTDVANTDAWGRRLGYCAYDYGSQPTVAATGRIRGSTDSSPTDSWVALVVISAGPDGVINTTSCPAAGTAASGVAATGDDMVAARSYGEMISFGNAQIASSLSGMGSKSTNKLCRLGSDGKMVCDIKTGLSGSNTANRFCRTNASGVVVCDVGYTDCPSGQASVLNANGWECTDSIIASEATICGDGQVSKWNGSNFDCVNFPTGPAGPAEPANCDGQKHGSTWTEACPRVCKTVGYYAGNVTTCYIYDGGPRAYEFGPGLGYPSGRLGIARDEATASRAIRGSQSYTCVNGVTVAGARTCQYARPIYGAPVCGATGSRGNCSRWDTSLLSEGWTNY